MDSKKYIDIAVQNPRGKLWVKLFFAPRNYNKWESLVVRSFGDALRSSGRLLGCGGLKASEALPANPKDYALYIFYAAIWAFGVLRKNVYDEAYWKKNPLATKRSPIGWVPMEIYRLDEFFENVIRPQMELK